MLTSPQLEARATCFIPAGVMTPPKSAPTLAQPTVLMLAVVLAAAALLNWQLDPDRWHKVLTGTIALRAGGAFQLRLTRSRQVSSCTAALLRQETSQCKAVCRWHCSQPTAQHHLLGCLLHRARATTSTLPAGSKISASAGLGGALWSPSCSTDHSDGQPMQPMQPSILAVEANPSFESMHVLHLQNP